MILELEFLFFITILSFLSWEKISFSRTFSQNELRHHTKNDAKIAEFFDAPQMSKNLYESYYVSLK
jgi:hypothetical protein